MAMSSNKHSLANRTSHRIVPKTVTLSSWTILAGASSNADGGLVEMAGPEIAAPSF
jgi:hypothetical protein